MSTTKRDVTYIGFTGTRIGLTGIQVAKLNELVVEHSFNYGIHEAHHGDCIGADAEFHALIDNKRRAGVLVPYPHFVLHPCVPDNQRAYCHTDSRYDRIEEPLPPLVRNPIIVSRSGRMFACPAEMMEQKRGGTWSTIREARDRQKCWLTIIYPDGTYEEFNNELTEPVEVSLLSN